MFCRQCGAEIDENDAFCSKCGYKREQTEAQPEVYYEEQESYSKKECKKNNRWRDCFNMGCGSYIFDISRRR